MKKTESLSIIEQIELQQVSEFRIRYISKGFKVKIMGSTDVFRRVTKWWDDTINILESFVLLLLSQSNRELGIFKVSQGGLSGTAIDVRLICAVSILSGATQVILCHNHPSGNIRPSDADIRITEKIKNALALLDIILLDHVIITPIDCLIIPDEKRYFSFRDEGILNTSNKNCYE